MKKTYIPAPEKTFLCKFCSNKFITRYSQKKFCSQKCQQLKEYKYVAPTRLCKICKLETGRGNKYCNKHKIYNQSKPLKQFNCSNCTIEITGTGYTKYCKDCSILIFKNKSIHYRKFANLLKKQWVSEYKTCVWCKSLNITIDHIISFKKEGSLMDLKNLQPMCHLCNISKGNKMPPYTKCKRYIKYILNK